MDSSTAVWTGPFPIKDVSGYFLLLPRFIEIHGFNASSVDYDQTTQNAVSDDGLHCLQTSLLWDPRHKWVKMVSIKNFVFISSVDIKRTDCIIFSVRKALNTYSYKTVIHLSMCVHRLGPFKLNRTFCNCLVTSLMNLFQYTHEIETTGLLSLPEYLWGYHPSITVIKLHYNIYHNNNKITKAFQATDNNNNNKLDEIMAGRLAPAEFDQMV